LKQDCVNFQRLMKISYVIFFVGLSCDRADALSQDWPCEEFYVYKTGVINDSDNEFEYSYKGETSKYIIDINLLGSHLFPNLFANCGTSGCLGTITEKSTTKSDSLRFFCEEYNEDYTKAKCHISFGDEAIFAKESKNSYSVHYCADNPKKILRFNVSDCEKCHCLAYWYDEDSKNMLGSILMACKIEKTKAHCFTYSGYEQWQNFNNNAEDYENCVGLSLE